MIIVSMKTEKDWVMPWLIGWRTSAVAATFGSRAEAGLVGEQPAAQARCTATYV